MPRLTAAAPRRGFTLVELLVTIVVLGVIGTLLATTMLGQQRFFQRSYEMVGVRRELRTAMSLMPTDMRGVSSVGGDVLDFTASDMTFRSTIGASIVCERPAGSASTVILPPLDLAHNTLTSWAHTPAAGDMLFAFDEGALRGAEDDAWVPLTVTSVTPTSVGCAGAPFTDPVDDAGKPRFSVTVAEVIPATVIVGAGLRFTRDVQYALEQSDETERWYLTQSSRVGGAWNPPVVVSGPYEALDDGGMQLVYFDSTGTEIIPAGAGAAVGLARVDLTMRAAGLPGSGPVYLGGDVVPRDSIAFRIAIRNRQ
jgi:prepilin-type N-terminal cleavage/methylation domain-containing protein